ncbi:ribonuclease 1-like [Tripterygium wilfordii]|uniref:ribonuclease 1-like n=1 Tax=Tripterygium wilfordii TaxID=458696 RepID=UPI0018F82753|nr:ribonuclease 1-like [Tripterygium wilfordii]
MAKAFAIALVFLAFGTRAETKTGPYDSTVLSLQWPVSFCTAFRVKCDEPIGKNFTIHGLWLMYSVPEKGSTTVDAYDINKGCTTITPKPKDRINKKLLKPIRRDLKIYWHDIVHPQNESRNIENWQYQWEKHGMCFDDPNQPLHYFQTALVRAKSLNILDILSLQKIEVAIKESLRVQPIIVCNDYGGRLLLFEEVHICYHKNEYNSEKIRYTEVWVSRNWDCGNGLKQAELVKASLTTVVFNGGLACGDRIKLQKFQSAAHIGGRMVHLDSDNEGKIE